MGVVKRLIKPLASRKVRTALTTVIAAYLAEYGLDVSPQIVLTILGAGVAVILGIAHEDAGAKAGLKVRTGTVTKLKQATPAS